MFVKWLQRVFWGTPSGTHAPATTAAPMSSGQTVDVVREAMKAQAAELGGLVHANRAQAHREQRRKRVKAMVEERIDPALANDFVIEEVTERIFEAAEFDPHYQEMVD